MKMTKLEKRFVNRRKKAEKNIKRVGDGLKQIEVKNINSALEIGCGIGLVSAYLANQQGISVYGTDFDPDEIKPAKEINEEGPVMFHGPLDGRDYLPPGLDSQPRNTVGFSNLQEVGTR